MVSFHAMQDITEAYLVGGMIFIGEEIPTYVEQTATSNAASWPAALQDTL